MVSPFPSLTTHHSPVVSTLHRDPEFRRRRERGVEAHRPPSSAAFGILACWAVVVLILVSACGGEEAPDTFGTYEEQPARVSNNVVHVHGLDINPANGLLYAATHTGLFRIEADGSPTRVGEGYQDTMGFTIVGPNQFFGSGHPDQRDYLSRKWPGLLGLIRSEDGGLVWESVSLKGAADFHDIELVEGHLYGYDSTGEALLLSRDGGKSWQSQAKIQLSDFAVNPANAKQIVATSGGAVMVSVDEGTSWGRRQTTAFVLLSWPTESQLWAVDASGQVFVSSDAGGTWNKKGALPRKAEALLAEGMVLYAAVQDGGILRSEDGGVTWEAVFKEGTSAR